MCELLHQVAWKRAQGRLSISRHLHQEPMHQAFSAAAAVALNPCRRWWAGTLHTIPTWCRQALGWELPD